MEIASLTLKDKEERRLLRGHLWVYRNELQTDPALADGAVVDVFSANRRFVGRGFYQAQGGIAARIVSRRQDDFTAAYFEEVLAAALALRERLFPGSTAYRWVFGESDALPGLVIDRYGAYAVAQTQCAFYTPFAKCIARILLGHPGVKGVVFEAPGLESNDEGGRPGRCEFGECPREAEIELDGLKLHVALHGGQKTGMFLDQRLNAAVAAPLAQGQRVLDAHANIGQWGLRMALAGAAHVHALDTSQVAIAAAIANAALNGVGDRCTFEQAATEDVLARDKQYGVIVLDPPAFAKARSHATKALTRYQSLNRAALRALEPGGILITCSCSHFVSTEDFLEAIKRAGVAEGRTLQLLELRGAAPDHPVLLSMPEAAYLKCAVLRAV